MKPTKRLSLFLLIFLMLCGTVPAVNALAAGTDFDTAEEIFCNDPPLSYSGDITSPTQEDYYFIIDIAAGQKLTIDVDAQKLGSTLYSLVEVFDKDRKPVIPNVGAKPASAATSEDDSGISGSPTIDLDPYVEITADVAGTYYLVISAIDPDVAPYNTGDYEFSLTCTDPPSTPDPVDVGDLLGATGSTPGSLVDLNIDPFDATSPVRFPFPLETGLIVDMDYDFSTEMLFVATDIDNHSRIVTINPNDGTIGTAVFDYGEGEFLIALESAGETLYGVESYKQATGDTSYVTKYRLVTIDRGTLVPEEVISFAPVDSPFESLAYDPTENALYGVSGTALIKIDLTALPLTIDTVNEAGFNDVVALDFSDENILYGVDRSGNLFEIPDLTSGTIEVIKPIDATDGVSALTFVVGEAPQDEDPPIIKTICSSSFTNQAGASSESANNRLRRFKKKRTPHNSAIGLYKLEGEVGETLQLSVCLEEKEAVESEEASTSSWIEKLWPQWKPKNRVFVVIRDAIPEVDFREKTKGVLTQDEPTLDITVELPATGLYYIMVIRPFRRLHNFDYCLSLESDGTAGDSLVVAWPNDESEENTPATSAEAKTVVEVQSDAVVDEGSSDTEDSTPTEPAAVVPALTAVEPLSVAPASSAVEPVEETTAQETVKAAPAEVAEEPMLMGAPEIPEETAVDETEEVIPEEPVVEATDEPMVKGAPAIPEETTVDETKEVIPEEPVVEATDEPLVKGAPEIPEEITVDETSDVVEEEPEASTP